MHLAMNHDRISAFQTGRYFLKPVPISPERLATYIDHTLLKPEAAERDISRLCQEAITYGFHAVCVNSCNIHQAASCLRDSTVKVCSVVGFPLGAVITEIKVMEARRAIHYGADEIDVVINLGALKSGNDQVVSDDLRTVVDACREGGALCKAILETSLLTEKEKARACELCIVAAADFVKTSTGFGPGGATVQDVALLYGFVSPHGLQVKASGGIRTYVDATKMIQAGAARLGTSCGIRIVDEAGKVAKGRGGTPDGHDEGS